MTGVVRSGAAGGAGGDAQLKATGEITLGDSAPQAGGPARGLLPRRRRWSKRDTQMG